MLRRLLLAAGGSATTGGGFVLDMSGLPVYNVESYGAVHNGSTDDAAAIQAAINAVPATGGIVYFPGGSYAVASTLTIGNGTSSAISTKQGVYLWGAAGPQIVGLAGDISPTTYGGVQLKWTGSAGGKVVQVAGPIVGWGIRNISINCQSVAGYGLFVTSAQAGDIDSLAVDLATTAGIWLTTVATFGGLFPLNFHNQWRNIFVRIPNGSASTTRGIVLTGAANNSNTSFETFDGVSIVIAQITVGNTAYGILLDAADNISIRQLHYSVTAGFTGTTYPLVFNYSVSASQPGGVTIDGVDFGNTSRITAVAVNAGSAPSSATKNRIVNIRGTDTGTPPSDPGLSNLSWGYTAANP